MNRAAVSIPEKLFFKIGEVCDITGIQAHVLRYWESEFPMLAPQKNRAGQRTYRKRDVEMVLRIKELLYEDQYTIAGAKKRLTNELRGASKLKVVTPEMSAQACAVGAPTRPRTRAPLRRRAAPLRRNARRDPGARRRRRAHARHRGRTDRRPPRRPSTPTRTPARTARPPRSRRLSHSHAPALINFG